MGRGAARGDEYAYSTVQDRTGQDRVRYSTVVVAVPRREVRTNAVDEDKRVAVVEMGTGHACVGYGIDPPVSGTTWILGGKPSSGVCL